MQVPGVTGSPLKTNMVSRYSMYGRSLLGAQHVYKYRVCIKVLCSRYCCTEYTRYRSSRARDLLKSCLFTVYDVCLSYHTYNRVCIMPYNTNMMCALTAGHAGHVCRERYVTASDHISSSLTTRCNTKRTSISYTGIPAQNKWELVCTR